LFHFSGTVIDSRNTNDDHRGTEISSLEFEPDKQWLVKIVVHHSFSAPMENIHNEDASK
jgi:hypothetical protein